MLSRNAVVFYVIPLIVAAFLATLASGAVGSLSGWGLPLPWKTGGCIQTPGGPGCSGPVDYNWPYFVVDASFYLLIGYVLLQIIHRIIPGQVERLAILRPKTILFLVLTASVITLATGWLTTEELVSPGGFWSQIYGFPLPWKTTTASCPPPCLQANGTSYDWISLTGDLLFYTTAAYGIQLYSFRKPGEKQLWKRRLESTKVLAVLALAVIGLSAGNYAYDAIYGTGNHWTGYGRLSLDHYTFQNSNQLNVWLTDIGPGNVTLVSLYIRSASGYGTVASFQLATTIDPGSLAMISENTTSQGLTLTQNSSYSLEFVTSQSVQTTFTVT